VDGTDRAAAAVEDLLKSHPDVTDAVVFRGRYAGREHDIAGISTSPLCSLIDIRDFLWGHLGDDPGVDLLALLTSVDRNEHGIAEVTQADDIDPVTLDVAWFEPPATPTEVTIAELWCAVLNRPRIAAGDDFLDLGGDSLAALAVLDMARARLGVDIGLEQFFAVTSLRSFARLVGSPAVQPGSR
jgi:hypothetical protein